MKKLKLAFGVFVLVVTALVFVSCKSVTIDRVYVNEAMHAIAEYSDGNTEDLGYVGVEVEVPVEVEVEVPVEVVPPLYTVTFYDAEGFVLSVENVYKGLSAKAPAVPEVADKAFDRWDTDFSKVTKNLFVRPIYIAAKEYTVKFLDENGGLLKTEKVAHGHSATAPTAPLRSNTVFEGWSSDFSSVTSDLTVRAIYRAKKTLTVTFKDYNGLTLGTASVKEGENATPPTTPTRDGYTFRGWSSSLSGITANKTVTAEYTLIPAENVFDLAYSVSDSTVTVTLSLAGNVSLAGFEGALSFDGMTATAVTGNSSNVLAHLANDGTVTFAYTSVTNVTKGEKVLTVTLTKKADTGKAKLTLSDCFDQYFNKVDYSIIGETIKLK